MGRQVLLAVAGGEGAFDDTVAWAMRCVVQPQDSLHIASVIRGPPSDMSFTRAFGDYSAIAAGAWQLEREAQEASARNTLDQVLQIVRDVGFRGEISQVLLKPAQGASYSGAAIVKYARARKVDLAVLGNRKIKGLLKRNLAALRGEASTSAYCAAHLKCPCVVIPQGITPVGHQPALLVESVGDSGTWVAIPAVKSRLPMKLCIEVNLPEPDMLTWSLESLARGPWDEIHLVAVYSTITVQANGYMPEKGHARKATCAAADILIAAGASSASIVRYELPDHTKQSTGRVSALCDYIERNGIHAVTVLAQQRGILTRALQSVLPRSATHVDRCLMNAPSPVVLYREVAW